MEGVDHGFSKMWFQSQQLVKMSDKCQGRKLDRLSG